MTTQLATPGTRRCKALHDQQEFELCGGDPERFEHAGERPLHMRRRRAQGEDGAAEAHLGAGIGFGIHLSTKCTVYTNVVKEPNADNSPASATNTAWRVIHSASLRHEHGHTRHRDHESTERSAPSPSGKALDCKSGIRRFDSDRRLCKTRRPRLGHGGFSLGR